MPVYGQVSLAQGYIYCNLTMDGTIQQLTAALDLNNNAIWKLDPNGTSASASQVYCSKAEYQSDPDNNAAGIRWIYYQRALSTDPLPGPGHPTITALTKANSFKILPSGDMMDFKSLINELRADQILLNNIFVQGATVGDVFHVRFPLRLPTF